MILGRTESPAGISNLEFMVILIGELTEAQRVWVSGDDSDGSCILRMRRYGK